MRQAGRIAVERCADVEHVQSTVYDAVTALGGRMFDVVYMGKGAMCYLPDLDRWAGVVAGLVRPGGVLYVVEFHPLRYALGVAAVAVDGSRRGWLVPEHSGQQRLAPELALGDSWWAGEQLGTGVLKVPPGGESGPVAVRSLPLTRVGHTTRGMPAHVENQDQLSRAGHRSARTARQSDVGVPNTAWFE